MISLSRETEVETRGREKREEKRSLPQNFKKIIMYIRVSNVRFGSLFDLRTFNLGSGQLGDFANRDGFSLVPQSEAA